MELHELAHDPVLAKDLGHGQDKVRGGRPGGQLAIQAEADDHRQRLVEGLPQEGGFGLDAAHAPAHHAEPVDHGRVGVGPDQRVGEGDQIAGLVGSGADHVCQELQVYLVDDAGSRRDDAEVAERLLRPAEEGVALAVALVLTLHIDQEGRLGPVLVHLHRVVDHQVGGNERVDAGRVAAHLGHGVAHGGQVDDARHAGEILEDDAGRHEWELVFTRVGRVPGGEGPDVVGVYQAGARGGVAQRVLEQDLDREWELRQIGHAGRVEAVVGVRLVANADRGARSGGVDRGGRTGHGMRLLRHPRLARRGLRRDRRRTGAPVPGRELLIQYTTGPMARFRPGFQVRAAARRAAPGAAFRPRRDSAPM